MWELHQFLSWSQTLRQAKFRQSEPNQLACSAITNATAPLRDLDYPVFTKAKKQAALSTRKILGLPKAASIWSGVQFGTSPILHPHFVHVSMYCNKRQGLRSVPLHLLFVQPLGSSLVHFPLSIFCICSLAHGDSSSHPVKNITLLRFIGYNFINSSIFHSVEVCCILLQISRLSLSFLSSSVSSADMFSRPC